jgi:hypothetical protein
MNAAHEPGADACDPREEPGKRREHFVVKTNASKTSRLQDRDGTSATISAELCGSTVLTKSGAIRLKSQRALSDLSAKIAPGRPNRCGGQ